MRHRKNIAKLGRKADHRKALLRNLATSLALHGKISTTQAKAKALVAYFERLITLAKRNTDMNAIRLLKSHLFTEASQKAFMDRLKTLDGKASGYLRMTKLGLRDGDRAEMVQVDFVSAAPAAK